MLTMNELQKQAFELYHAKRYADMSDLLTREIDVFPLDGRTTYYNWQMCAAALQGTVDQALAYFQQALDAGCWYGKRALVEDPDLTVLHGNPEFERLSRLSQERMAEVQASAVPVLKVFPPKDAQPPYPWLMFLHGNSSNLQSHNLEMLLANLQPAADQGWLIALPQSSQSVMKGSYVWDEIDWSIREVQNHLAAINREHSIVAANGIIGGYSMGGGLSLYMALTGKIAVRGVVVAAPWWSNSAELEAAIAAGGADHLRVAIIVSRNDVDCHRVALAVDTALKARNLPCTLIITDEPDHRFPDGFRDLLTAELNAVPLTQ